MEMKGKRTERKEEKEMWHVVEEGPHGGAVEPAAEESVSGDVAYAFVDTTTFSLKDFMPLFSY